MAHLVGHGFLSRVSVVVLLLVNDCMVVFAMHPMLIMFVTGSVFIWLWGAFFACLLGDVAEMLRDQRSRAMVTTAFDRTLDLLGRDPLLVVGQSGTAGNRVYGGSRYAIEPHQLLLDAQSPERREKISYVQLDGPNSRILADR